MSTNQPLACLCLTICSVLLTLGKPANAQHASLPSESHSCSCSDVAALIQHICGQGDSLLHKMRCNSQDELHHLKLQRMLAIQAASPPTCSPLEQQLLIQLVERIEKALASHSAAQTKDPLSEVRRAVKEHDAAQKALDEAEANHQELVKELNDKNAERKSRKVEYDQALNDALALVAATPPATTPPATTPPATTPPATTPPATTPPATTTPATTTPATTTPATTTPGAGTASPAAPADAIKTAIEKTAKLAAEIVKLDIAIAAQRQNVESAKKALEARQVIREHIHEHVKKLLAEPSHPGTSARKMQYGPSITRAQVATNAVPKLTSKTVHLTGFAVPESEQIFAPQQNVSPVASQIGHRPLLQNTSPKAQIDALAELSKREASDYFDAKRKIREAADAWKSDDVVRSFVFDLPATFPDPDRSSFESGNSAIIREGMRFASDGHGNWTLDAPYTAGLSPAEIHMQLLVILDDMTQHTITLKPLCLPARTPCRSKGCSGTAACERSDHSDCQSTLKLKGYLPALDRSNGCFHSVSRRGYAVYGSAYAAK